MQRGTRLGNSFGRVGRERSDVGDVMQEKAIRFRHNLNVWVKRKGKHEAKIKGLGDRQAGGL